MMPQELYDHANRLVTKRDPSEFYNRVDTYSSDTLLTRLQTGQNATTSTYLDYDDQYRLVSVSNQAGTTYSVMSRRDFIYDPFGNVGTWFTSTYAIFAYHNPSRGDTLAYVRAQDNALTGLFRYAPFGHHYHAYIPWARHQLMWNGRDQTCPASSKTSSRKGLPPVWLTPGAVPQVSARRGAFQGVPLAAIQQQLGHSSPLTTVRYLASIGAHDAHAHVAAAFAATG